MAKSILATLTIMFATAACASTETKDNAARSATDEAAYQQCLQDNMAASIAWEMIEQNCREQVGGEEADPLDVLEE